MSKLLTDQVKMNAVAEALGGMGTLAMIAQKYGLSIGYLSILAARAREAICNSNYCDSRREYDAIREKIKELSTRLSILEDKINHIFK